VDAIQAGLGDAFLLLASLGVVLLAIIVVLVEVDFIVRLGGKVTRRLRSSWLNRSAGRAGRTSQEDGG
jgi:hypothetical protein